MWFVSPVLFWVAAILPIPYFITRGLAAVTVVAFPTGSPKTYWSPNLWSLYACDFSPSTPSETNSVTPSANLVVGIYKVWKSTLLLKLAVEGFGWAGFASRYNGSVS